MIELIPEKKDENNNEAEFYIGTLVSWSNSTGNVLRLDGQTDNMQKPYKMLRTPRPIHSGSRVLIMKHSGTYIVLGEIGLPNSWKAINDLASNASTADIINKINEIIGWLRTQGIVWTS